MVQIICISGNWRFEENRWLFVADKRGNREVQLETSTTFEGFEETVYEEYGVNRRKQKIELTYMFPRKVLAKLPIDTRPVLLRNCGDVKDFFAQFKDKTCRLCVSVTKLASLPEESNWQHNPKKRGKWVDCEDNVVDDDGIDDEESIFHWAADSDGVDNDGSDEEDSIFDWAEDSDGASSGDEDYDLYGKLKEEENKPDNSTVYVAEVKESMDQATYCKTVLKSLDIAVGKRFDNKEDLMTKLQILSVVEKFDFNVAYSRPDLLIVKCWIEGCKWRVRATTVGDSPKFHIKVYVKEHTCSVTERGRRNRQATKEVLGKMYYDTVGNVGPKVTPEEVANALNNGCGVKIGYWKAHRALRHARLLATGTPESGYEQLPSYLYLIRKANPGTVTRLEIDEDNRFKSLFISFGASINGFQYMRKVLVVDGTYLKGKYKGTLLVATSQDGNFKIYPIAFAVVDTENDESWEWFFTQLSSVIPDDGSLAIISDRHKSIANAVGKVYPLACRGICTYHMYKNILMRFKGGDAFRLVKKAANAYRISDFNVIFNEIQDLNPDLHAYLLKADVKVWSRAHFPGHRYNILTSNIAESINKVLSNARSLPITKLLDAIRSMLTRWFSERRHDAGLMRTILTRGAEKLIEPRVSEAQMVEVQEIDADQVQVTIGRHIHVVNVRARRCTCRRFDLLKLPCVHAIAAGEAKKKTPIRLTSPFYYKTYLVNAYTMSVMPRDITLPVPAHVAERKCLPPVVRQHPGRPKKTRYKSALEKALEIRRPRKNHICSNCGKAGHNRRTCGR